MPHPSRRVQPRLNNAGGIQHPHPLSSQMTAICISPQSIRARRNNQPIIGESVGNHPPWHADRATGGVLERPVCVYVCTCVSYRVHPTPTSLLQTNTSKRPVELLSHYRLYPPPVCARRLSQCFCQLHFFCVTRVPQTGQLETQ